MIFVTSNINKVREFEEILGKKIEHMNIDYKEMRSDSPEEIAKDAAKSMAEQLDKAVIVEDSGLFIEALKGFPGTCSAYIHKRIGLKGILTLMKGIENRNCSYKSAIGYCEPGGQPISFLGEEKGAIAEEIKGDNGFGHDPIFIPEDSDRTYGQTEEAEKHKKFRRNAVIKLKEFLEKTGKTI